MVDPVVVDPVVVDAVMVEPRPYRAPKVLYVGGTGRTGSTVLARLLGELPGWFSAGELAFLWRYGLVAGGRCSCGDPIAECELWSEVLARAVATTGPIDAERMVKLRRRFWSVHLPLMVSGTLTRRGLARLEEFPTVVEAVYREAASATGATVLVDSSKEPHYSFILRERTDLDLYFLHLVRDPRAVGHSWRRPRREIGFAGDVETEHRGPVRASAYYDVSNVAAEALWRAMGDRYRIMRYEDFATDPAAAVGALGEFVGEPVDPQTVLNGRSFVASDQHLTWGNPNRFEAGKMEIRSSERWRDELGAIRAAALTALCGPVARRYGYAWRPRARLGALPPRFEAVSISKAETR